MLCMAAALAIATDAFPKGGTYHNSEPYSFHPDNHKTHSRTPAIVWSPEHHHYHVTYHSPP
jgi:hypothetical protein